MVDSLQAALNQAEWRLDQRSVVSPDAGIVADVLAKRGETLAAAAPVVSLLAPGKDLRVLLHSGGPTLARHTARKSHLSAITVRRTGRDHFLHCAVGQIYAPFTCSKSNGSKFVFLAEASAAEDEGRATRPRPAGDGDACRRPAIRDYVIDVSGVA